MVSEFFIYMRAHKKRDKKMVTGLGAMDLKNPKYIKLNSELGTSATAKASVATTASKTRSSGTAARIMSNSSGVTSGSVFFTKAVKFSSQPRPTSGRDLSLYANARRAAGQRYNALSQRYWGDNPSYATYNQAQVAYKQSSASSFGEALGALAGLVTTGANAYKTLNEAGIFGHKSESTGQIAQSRGKNLTSQVDKVLGGSSNISMDDLSSSGLRTASSFGSNFNSNYSAIKSAIESGNFDPQAIRSDVSSLVVKSTEDFYEAKATLSVLQAQQSDNAFKVEAMEADVQAAQADTDIAKTELGTSKSTLSSAKAARKTADEELANKKAEYKNACNDVTSAETEYSTAQTTVTKCETTYSSAKAKHSSATDTMNKAKSTLDSIPNDTEHALERQAAQKVYDQAKAAEEQAKAEEDKAKEELDKAKDNLNKTKDKLDGAKATKEEMLKGYSKAEKSVADAAKKCQDAQENVDKRQAEYDANLQKSDMCQSSYEQAKTTLECANGIAKQASDLSGKMRELEQNVKNADKLQASSEKSIEKFLKKNPDYSFDTGNIVKDLTVTGRANGKKISQMNMDELLAKRKELESQPNPDADGIALVDSYINRYKDQVAGKVEDGFDFSGEGKVRKQGETRETTQLRLSKQQQKIQNETNIATLQRILQDANARGDRDTARMAYERISALSSANPGIDSNQWAGSDIV